MTQQRETLKAKLLAEAEQAIEAMLKQLLDDEAMSQSAMEQIAGDLEERLGRATVQTLLDEQTARPSEAVLCPSCGTRMQRRGKRSKQLMTTRGEVKLERPYYASPRYGNRRFPTG